MVKVSMINIIVHTLGYLHYYNLKPPMQGFFIDDTQCKTIIALYNSDKIDWMQYRNTVLSQLYVQLFLQHHKLDNISLEQLESWWTASWSNKWVLKKEHSK
jgi:hypothetical protein